MLYVFLIQLRSEYLRKRAINFNYIEASLVFFHIKYCESMIKALQQSFVKEFNLN